MTEHITHPPETIDRSTAARDLRLNIADVMRNPENPLHEGYLRGDPDVMQAIDREYAKLYGKGTIVVNPDTVEISLTLGGK